MKPVIAATLAVPFALVLAGAPTTASASTEYHWQEDCRDAPGNNLKCVRIKTMVKYQDGTGKANVHVDRVTFTLSDWCGAARISGGTGWGVLPFQLTGGNGDTTFYRYYVVPAGCKYHLHGRRVTGIDDVGAADMHTEWTNDHNCVEFNVQDSHVNEYTCDANWPTDGNTGKVPLE